MLIPKSVPQQPSAKMGRCYCTAMLILAAVVVSAGYVGAGPLKCTVKLDVSVCYSTEQPANATARECEEAEICKKQFNISYVELEPYSSEIVSDLLRTCCGPCVKSSEINKLTKVSEVSAEVMRESHFVFPVLGRPDTTNLYGHRFIPLIETPNVYYITIKSDNVLQELIMSCLQMWPLLIICVLMVLIAGFLCWLAETWGNEKEFPRTFMKGWFEGIWWAFISMTTVGYGDKAPRSIAARCFSIIWIVVGITTFSLVTAMLTSQISTANSMPPPSMENANVGVIRHRIYESILIANQGGILIDVHPVNITEGILELVNRMKSGEIDGFVLDRYTLMLFYNYFEPDPRYGPTIRYLRMKSLLTEITHVEQFLYGVLVKDDEDYNFLEDFMTSNRDVINTCNSLFLNHYSRRVRVQQERYSLFSTKGQLFWPSFISCLCIIVVLLAVGGTYSWRQKEKKKVKEVEKNGCGEKFLMT